MILKKIGDQPRNIVLDGSHLCEVLHPERDTNLNALPYSLAHGIVSPGKATHPHRLKSSSEVYVIVSGTGRMYAGEQEAEIGAGQVILIEPGETQWLRNTGLADLVFLVIVEPYWREGDEELIRYPDIPEP